MHHEYFHAIPEVFLHPSHTPPAWIWRSLETRFRAEADALPWVWQSFDEALKETSQQLDILQKRKDNLVKDQVAASRKFYTYNDETAVPDAPLPTPPVSPSVNVPIRYHMVSSRTVSHLNPSQRWSIQP